MSPDSIQLYEYDYSGTRAFVKTREYEAYVSAP